MHDLVIEDALIVDGTGAEAFHGSVAVREGRIAAVSREARPGDAAAERIDAGGRALAPGFIDPHTHYDAQVAWDPLLTCSPAHGVTSVVMGNCGVGGRSGAPRGARGGHVGSGQRGGHPVRGHAARDRVALGGLSRLPGRHRDARARHQCGRSGPSDPAAPVRDGRCGVRARRQRRRARRHGAPAARGDRGGRLRLLDDPAQQPPRLRGPSHRLPQRRRGGARSALRRAARAGPRLDRAGAGADRGQHPLPTASWRRSST